MCINSTPAENHAKCDSWVKSQRIFIFDILFELPQLTEINFSFPYKPCSYEIKIIQNALQIKGDNCVNDTQIQLHLLDLQC